MVDMFVVLVLPGSGDELQGIKRGILELADIVVVTKADGDNVARAKRTQQQYAAALRLHPPRDEHWQPRVSMCSAVAGDGVEALWATMLEHHAVVDWDRRRREQNVAWMWQAVDEELRAATRSDPRVPALEAEVRAGRLGPDRAAAQLVASRPSGPTR
jgi:LAO/AO transport system kinase